MNRKYWSTAFMTTGAAMIATAVFRGVFIDIVLGSTGGMLFVLLGAMMITDKEDI